ncbi:SRPBCC family protein [Actinocatenispora rupis]|uniref:Polyketide cyclase / dehydrase and lipid transport n=1 Tax=Actinocatenispora rupis TaxID=519421 RepID=A0A8J3JCG9_9ACTN|nr:SRPBCC family protein [Actinocatenispora rupis]GID14214.1 hypothetical protein Aru02nite_51030 [Actinocatenispora rupis]
MATISREIRIDAGAADVWAVIGDFAAGPRRMAPDLVLDSHVDGDCRVVTFADGTIARERLVTVDHPTRRIVYSVVGDTVRPVHDNAVMQVVPDGPDACRFVWTRDVLPDDLAPFMDTAMTTALPVIARTLSRRPGSGAA